MIHIFPVTNLLLMCCQIRSDKDRKEKVEYYLTGPGANKPPVNLFVVDHITGFVRITDIVDRERYPFFNVSESMCIFFKQLEPFQMKPREQVLIDLHKD